MGEDRSAVYASGSTLAPLRLHPERLREPPERFRMLQKSFRRFWKRFGRSGNGSGCAKSLSGASGSVSGAPEIVPDAPETVPDAPKVFPEVPEAFWMLRKSFRKLPKTFQTLRKRFGRSRRILEAPEEVPEARGSVLEASGAPERPALASPPARVLYSESGPLRGNPSILQNRRSPAVPGHGPVSARPEEPGGGTMIVSVHGAELFYSTSGPHGNGGPERPVCLVLSAIGTLPYERQMLPPLRDALQLVFVDLRGGGRSTGEPADLTFDVLATDLEAVRVDLGVARIAVLGHSILGMLAIEYGRRCPETVSHVITAGASPTGDMAHVAAAAGAFFQVDASEERKQILHDNLARLGPGAAPGQTMLAQTPARFFDPRFDSAPLFAGAVYKPRLLQQAMGTLSLGWDVTVGASSLRVPLFLAHGRYDYIVPYTLWEGLPERLPNATLQLFERSGHQPFFEEPDRFAAAVTDWLRRQDC